MEAKAIYVHSLLCWLFVKADRKWIVQNENGEIVAYNLFCKNECFLETGCQETIQTVLDLVAEYEELNSYSNPYFLMSAETKSALE